MGLNLTGNRGKSLQNLVEASPIPNGKVYHINAGVRWVKDDEGDSSPIMTKGPVDFIGGVQWRDEIACVLAFDCKMSAKEKTLYLTDAQFPKHQRHQLEDLADIGAIAGILAANTLTEKLYWIDIRRLAHVTQLDWSDLDEVGTMDGTIQWERIFSKYR